MKLHLEQCVVFQAFVESLIATKDLSASTGKGGDLQSHQKFCLQTTLPRFSIVRTNKLSHPCVKYRDCSSSQTIARLSPYTAA